MAIITKSKRDIEAMRDAAKINVEALLTMRDAAKAGTTTAALDKIAYDIITGHGGTPAFLGYPPGGRHPYPATINASINEELVHGIPTESRTLKDGDIVSLDVGTVYHGFVADCALTVGVGEIDETARRLMKVTEEALYVGIDCCVVGNRFGDVSHAIQEYAEGAGYNVVREYGGHGVGRAMHEEPHIPNWGKAGRGHRLRAGMTFALEPMLMLGDPATRVLNDYWTVVTADGKLCAHFEHTIAVTDNGPEILTKWD